MDLYTTGTENQTKAILTENVTFSLLTKNDS